MTVEKTSNAQKAYSTFIVLALGAVVSSPIWFNYL